MYGPWRGIGITVSMDKWDVVAVDVGVDVEGGTQWYITAPDLKDAVMRADRAQDLVLTPLTEDRSIQECVSTQQWKTQIDLAWERGNVGDQPLQSQPDQRQ